MNVAFKDIGNFLESRAKELGAEDVSSAEYWIMRLGITEEDWQFVIDEIAEYSFAYAQQRWPFVSAFDMMRGAISCALNYGMVFGTQYEDVTTDE